MSGYDHLFKITVSYSEVTTFIVPFFSLNVVLIYRKKIPTLANPPWNPDGLNIGLLRIPI
jgi:hypothetical protein